MSAFRPLSDWVLVQLVEVNAYAQDAERRNAASLIHLPDASTYSNLRHGVVLAVGPGKHNSKGVLRPTEVKPGERVCFFRWNTEHKSGQAQQHVLDRIAPGTVLIREPDILSVVQGDSWPT